ncbi:MAG: hypothetical protein IH957_10970 [Chloroflexi bacterium]|nr:hypothetical protein [Chloroflexota bacterium]
MRRLLIRSLLYLEAGLLVALVALVAIYPANESAAGPFMNNHWHATYEISVCGQRLPHLRFWEGGIHTHDDGIVHSHPIRPSEEGKGASLASWFEYGGGRLSSHSMLIPGARLPLENGAPCPDGSPGELQITVNDERLRRWSNYIPQHEDHIVIVFGPKD